MVDPIWVTCIKESTAFAFAVVWIVLRSCRGLAIFPPWKEVGILLAVGLAVQFVGNLGYLWALGKIGLAVTTPANYGAQLLATALMGRMILGERVTFRSAMALGILMIALALLGFGVWARQAGSGASPAAEIAAKATTGSDCAAPVATIMLAAGAACLAGVVFAGLSTAMRRSSNMSVDSSTLLFIVAGVGAVTMWPLSFYRIGIDGLLATSPEAMHWILGASLFNLMGFLGIAKGLQLTSVVHASVLNSSQVAMLALVGMFYFDERTNFWLISGVIVTLLGILLIDRPVADDAVEVTI